MTRTFCLTVAAAVVFAAAALAQGGAVTVSWPAKSAVGATATLSAAQIAPGRHTVQFATTGSPTTCTLRLEGSLDGTTFADLSGPQDCKTSGMFHVSERVVLHLRAYVISLSGGTSPAVQPRYVGVR